VRGLLREGSGELIFRTDVEIIVSYDAIAVMFGGPADLFAKIIIPLFRRKLFISERH
jgi:hypothetical protein